MSIRSRIVASPKFWGAYFKIYDRLAGMRANQRLLNECVRYLKVRPEGNYLDLCCGTGNSTDVIAKAGGRVLGLDLSPEGLRRAKGKVVEAGFGRADMDKSLPLAPLSLDGVLAINALYLSADPGKVFSEVFRMLKPGGRFVLSNPRKGARPSNILLEDQRLEWERLEAEYDVAVGAALLAVHVGIRLADFMAFLPFQLVLKGGSPHFEYAEFWRELALKWSFTIERHEPTLYGGDNDTFALVKP